ncbi:MAG: RHS repeat-associated core domain-containing protein, partial [Hydrococcus sp. C42_A2020_068]|nr:RHS repeat-associated core domain-containing protein [Hydrococcus sp. C42_A2020_068]
VTSRKDFSAFGEETITPQRTQGLGYVPPNIRQDYTGYQKDDESGLEFAQARYYNPMHGRFTSVDPLTASATIRNPQTFNRYAYALNSPYKFTDPLGLIPSSTGACGTWCPGGDSGSFGSGGGHQDISGNFLPKQQKPKKIYVFVFLTEEEQTLQSTVTNTKDPKDSRTEIFVGALDFSAVIASAPKGTEVIIKGPEATVEDFQNALKDEGAAVVFIGHASGVTVHPAGQPSRFIADGLLIGGLNDETQTYYQEDTKVDVKASFVAVFGCDTQNLSGLFKGAANFIAVDSGSDGLSPTPAIAQAGVAALLSIIRGDNAGKVENSANAALVK